MIVKVLESWLSRRWSHYKPTRHMRGTYGLVFVLEATKGNVTPQRICVKTLNPEKLKISRRDVKSLFERELRLWLNIPFHSHVLPALGLEFAPPPPDLAGVLEVLPLVRMPFCDSNLSACIKGEISISLVDRLIILAQICSGLQWLYKHGVEGHGDLKPDNILLRDLRTDFNLPDRQGFPSKAHYWQARITDLGWADIWKQGGGTYHAWRPYLAPERYRGAVVPEASDVFAAGVIACELLSGKHPAGDDTEKLAKKWNAEKWEKWANSGRRDLEFQPMILRDLVEKALDPVPSVRPSASKVQSVLCGILQQEYGIDLASRLSEQDNLARAWDITSRKTWAAEEMARLGEAQLRESIEELNNYSRFLNKLEPGACGRKRRSLGCEMANCGEITSAIIAPRR
jgi:serine/threonine protein kinase